MGDADFIKYRNEINENIGETIFFTNNQEIKRIINEMKKSKLIESFYDILDDELKIIYNPLSDINRANESNLGNGFLFIYYLIILDILKSFLYRFKKLIKSLIHFLHH